MLSRDERTVAVAFSDADVVAFQLDASRAERRRLFHLFAGLQRLGRIAAWTVRLPSGPHPADEVVDAIAGRVGRFAVNAVLTSGPARPEPAPERLLAVWPFDHVVGGMPVATGRIGALDLELLAEPSGDEERGIVLPGRPGLWTVRARTIGL